MKIKLISRLILPVVALFCVASANGDEPMSIIEESEFWPYRVELTEAVETGDKSLQKGKTGVLIRAERVDRGDTILIVDFGRHGAHHLPSHSTDIVSRMQRIRTGEERKLLPNYVQMLANKFVVLRPELNYKLKLEEFKEVDKFVFIYSKSIDHAVALLDHAKKLRGIEKSVVIVLPEEGIDGEQFRAAVRAHPVEAGVFFDHIALPYKMTLRHEAAKTGGIVVTNMEGLVLETIYLEDGL